jgi:hypothetical protein
MDIDVMGVSVSSGTFLMQNILVHTLVLKNNVNKYQIR